MTLDEEEKSGRDAYWRARESADTERDEPPDVISGGEEPDPEPDLTTAADFPGDTSPEAEPAPDTKTAADFPDTRPPLPAAPQKPAADDAFKSAITAALSRKYQPPAALSDEAIGRARSDREAKVHNNDVSRAISSWLMRKPFEPTPPEDTAGDLMQQRQHGQASFDKETGRQVSLAGLLAKGVKGEPAITPYQREELKLRREGIDRTAEQKRGALEDRKKLMLQLYPEHAAEIQGITDLGAAQTLQTALEGRAGRATTEAHADTAATRAQQHSDEMQRRSEGFSKAMKEWELSHRPLTAEQSTQLEGIEKSDAAIDTFQKALGDVSTTAGKAGAATGRIGGALGLPGTAFQSAREGTAIALARGLEGGMARPGNVEIITKMLPEASDADEVKAQKMERIREFIANNRDSFRRALEQGGSVPLKPIAPRPAPPPARKPRPNGVPANAVEKNGKWYVPYPDGSGWDEIEVTDAGRP